MGRIRTPAIGGLVEDNPLASGATTLTSAGLAALPTFGASDWGIVTFDPDGRTGEPFSKLMTAHTAGATTATIAAAAIQGTARSIDRDVRWAFTDIMDQDGNGAGLLGITSYNPASATDVATTAAALADVDATNAKVDFTVPPSGKVLARVTARATGASSTTIAWGLKDGSTTVGVETVIIGGALSVHTTAAWLITGLTAGAAKTYKLAHYREYGSGTVYTGYGGTLGPLIMEVWAVNV